MLSCQIQLLARDHVRLDTVPEDGEIKSKRPNELAGLVSII